MSSNTLGMDTCLIVYCLSRQGDQMVVEPYLWLRNESKIKDIISKVREISSTKTNNIAECFEKSDTKVEKVRNCTCDKILEKLQMGIRHLLRLLRILTNLVYSVSQKCIEQHQLSAMKHNGYCFVPFNSQMTSNTDERSSLSDVTTRDCSSHVPQELFGWSTWVSLPDSNEDFPGITITRVGVNTRLACRVKHVLHIKA
ncbi:hypothetical protein Bca101_010097 [Brassica carinata]